MSVQYCTLRSTNMSSQSLPLINGKYEWKLMKRTGELNIMNIMNKCIDEWKIKIRKTGAFINYFNGKDALLILKNLKHDYVIVSCNKLFSYGHKSRCKNVIIFLIVPMFLKYSGTHKTMEWTNFKQYVFEANSLKRTMKMNTAQFLRWKFTKFNP